jgi:hypothetical protein
MAFNQLCTASITSSSANFWPRKCSFIGPNKWKSDGTKSELYGECLNSSNFRACSVSTVCEGALSWSNSSLFEKSLWLFYHITGFNSFTSMSLYWALVTVFVEVHQYRAIDIPKDGQHDFPSRSLCLEFFCWLETVGVSTASIVFYSLVHNGIPRTRLLYYNLMEKSISFTSMTVQMLETDRLPCMFVMIGLLPWVPSAAHFPIPRGHHGQLLYAEPWLILNYTAVSSMVTCL